MLAIGRRLSILSLTKSGRTKSCVVKLVSRTRFLKAGDRRNRRGRWTNLRTPKSTQPRSREQAAYVACQGSKEQRAKSKEQKKHSALNAEFRKERTSGGWRPPLHCAECLSRQIIS